MPDDMSMIPEISLEEKEQLKLERLQSTLNRAYKNVPFHRNRFRENQLSPQDIVSLQDIRRLPFMDRSHLGKHYPYGLFAVPLRDIVRIHTAPGTGTQPSISGYTKADLLIWKKLVARSYGAASVTEMDIILIHLPPGLANWARDYKDGGETVGASVIPNSSLSLSKTLMVLRDYKATTLVTTPAFAEALMEHTFEVGQNPNELNLKRVILVGEPVDKTDAEILEERLHLQVWQNYGLSEIPGPAIAYECRSHCGLHINEDHILPEIVDPATGSPVADGEKGELVLTTLSARAFPLIRFRTGDMARIVSDACGCGSPFIKLQWLRQRADQMFIVSGIKISTDQVKAHLKSALNLQKIDCSMDRIRQGGTDVMIVSLVMDNTLFSDEIKELERLINGTEAALSGEVGVPVKIRLVQEKM